MPDMIIAHSITAPIANLSEVQATQNVVAKNEQKLRATDKRLRWRNRKVKRVCDPSNDVEAHTHVGRVLNCRVTQARNPQSSHIFGTNSFRRQREFFQEAQCRLQFS